MPSQMLSTEAIARITSSEGSLSAARKRSLTSCAHIPFSMVWIFAFAILRATEAGSSDSEAAEILNSTAAIVLESSSAASTGVS